MSYSRFQTGMALRATALTFTIVVVVWMIDQTRWYATIIFCAAAALGQFAALVRFATQSSREVARFLDAISFDDASQSFSMLLADGAHFELGTAMSRVLEQLRSFRSERQEQARYLETLVAHVPVALISVDERGGVRLLNIAARRLFGTAIAETAQFARHGEAFAVGLESIRPGDAAILRMERSSGSLQLKVAVTELALGGKHHRLISLQNIESEMSAQELAAWQTVIRVMAHEVMNSLTPVSSLAATAHKIVRSVLTKLPADDPRAVELGDAAEALDTVERRSQGLLHFVQGHRHLTKQLVPQIEVAPVQRIFARLQRLLANDLAARDIQFMVRVNPETLEIAADAELLDQALINLVRNAIEALRDAPAGHITLSAEHDRDGRVAIAVADNGPGIAPDQREKIFVPFFTTRRQGTGVGLTLVRQIAIAHGATVDVSTTPGGGATVTLRF